MDHGPAPPGGPGRPRGRPNAHTVKRVLPECAPPGRGEPDPAPVVRGLPLRAPVERQNQPDFEAGRPLPPASV